MSKSVAALALALVGLTVGVAWSQSVAPASPAPPLFDRRQGPMIERFASRAAFEAYVRSLDRKRMRRDGGSSEDIVVTGSAVPAPPPAMVAPLAQEAYAGAAPGNPEITNNQTVGVDEGGIVKQIGRHLVVLQDGRVFSVDLGRAGERPRLSDRVDVYRSEDVAASWYDEMLVLGDRVLVTAYNYRERATEMTVLRLDPANGRMHREGIHEGDGQTHDQVGPRRTLQESRDKPQERWRRWRMHRFVQTGTLPWSGCRYDGGSAPA